MDRKEVLNFVLGESNSFIRTGIRDIRSVDRIEKKSSGNVRYF
jgi:hypothetical protein